MIGADKVRLAIRELGKTVFTTPELYAPNLSARISDMVLTGEIKIVGKQPVPKRRPLIIYEYVGLPDVGLPEDERLTKMPVKGTRLYSIRFHEDTRTIRSSINYYPLPKVQSLAEMLSAQSCSTRQSSTNVSAR